MVEIENQKKLCTIYTAWELYNAKDEAIKLLREEQRILKEFDDLED